MKTVLEAQHIILEHTKKLPIEEVPLTECLGRILAEDAFSNRDHPPYDISAMDGYAVRFSDIEGASKDTPKKLKIVDDIRAGREPKCAVAEGEASCIMTGAPMPEGADTVVRVEDTDNDREQVKIFTASPLRSNVRDKAENLTSGDKVLSRGTEIGPSELGILAMVKQKTVKVHRVPTVAILSTGDELESLEEPFDPKKIPDANSYTVMAELKAMGVKAKLLGIAKDTQEDLEKKLLDGLSSDILIVSGGVSVGHHDFVRPTLEKLGIEMHFWRVALRPGHPFAFGTRSTGASDTEEGTLVFALPGNPVSSMVCAEQFLIPSVRKSMGAHTLFRRTVRATLRGDVKDKKGRMHFMRAFLEAHEDDLYVSLTGSQGSGILMSMVMADALLVMPEETKLLEDGARVTVQLFKEPTFQEENGLPEVSPEV